MQLAYLADRCRFCRVLALGGALGWQLVTSLPSQAAEPPGISPSEIVVNDLTNPDVDAAVLDEVDRRLRELDDNAFAVRQRAFSRLQELVGQPQMGPALALRIAQLLDAPDTSFEVRSQLERLIKQLPPALRIATSNLAKSAVDPAIFVEVDRRLQELDDGAFQVRTRAIERLRELTGQRQLAGPLSKRFTQALDSPKTSFEVRSQLDRLLKQLPPVNEAADDRASAADIGPLLDELNSPVYLRRDTALRKLQALAGKTELVGPLWLELKRRLGNTAVAPSGRRVFEPLVDRVHEAWLLADPRLVSLPVPAHEDIVRWIDEVSQLDELQTEGRRERTLAERELLDLIVRDDTREGVLKLLKERIESLGIAAEDAAARAVPGEAKEGSAPAGTVAWNGPLQELIDFARPCLAAEVWSNQAHVTVQYLIVDLPQYNEMTGLSTHFDRIDDITAHCVSGNSLTEGNYPVRIAIPHPEVGRETMFHLTNLPTPRRRLAYEYQVERDERTRLQEITGRTLEQYLMRDTPPSETDVLLLAQLDPTSVSKFVGTYFDTVANAHLVTTQRGLEGASSVHAGMCIVMCRMGTREAVPALEKLARGDTLGKLGFENPLALGWIAALAIAQRDAWTGVDDWLAGLIDDARPLAANLDFPPELGASAAGLLLDRHGASVRSFGLEATGEAVTDRFQFVGYRFTSSTDRDAVKQWWQKHKAELAKRKAAEPTTLGVVRGTNRPADLNLPR